MKHLNPLARLCELLMAASFLTRDVATLRAEEKPADKTAWKTSAGLGVTVTKGNTDTILFAGNIGSEKKWSSNELSLGAHATYGENQGVKNAESFGAHAQFNRLFSDRLLGFGRVDGLHDAIARVEYRATLSPGAGYYFIKSDRAQLRAEVGPGFVFEKLGGSQRSYYTLRAGENFQLKINDRARLWQTMEYLPKVDDLSNYLLNAEVGVETDITKKLSLRVFAQDTYRSVPAPGRKNNDIKLVAGVQYKF